MTPGPGPLALVGGDELHPGNETQDRVLVDAAAAGPSFVLATAAARHRPDLAVRNAVEWFGGLGLEVEELLATKRSHATSAEVAERARTGRFFYLVGGDPGVVPKTLAGTPVWNAIVGAWRSGAALAGSSAGAMALGEWTLIRDKMPGDDRRQYRAALRSSSPRSTTSSRGAAASALSTHRWPNVSKCGRTAIPGTSSSAGRY